MVYVKKPQETLRILALQIEEFPKHHRSREERLYSLSSMIVDLEFVQKQIRALLKKEEP